MNYMYFVCSCYLDVEINFTFNYIIKMFNSLEEAKNYMDVKFPKDDNTVTYDIYEVDRLKRISNKYIRYMWLECFNKS